MLSPELSAVGVLAPVSLDPLLSVGVAVSSPVAVPVHVGVLDESPAEGAGAGGTASGTNTICVSRMSSGLLILFAGNDSIAATGTSYCAAMSVSVSPSL